MTLIDVPAIDENEAQALMLHHLRLAASLFEVLPGDIKVHRSVVAEEAARADPGAEAALVWFDRLVELYMEDA